MRPNPLDEPEVPESAIVLPDYALSMLVRACEDDLTGWRNRAALALLFGAGLRGREAVEARLDDLDMDNRSVRVARRGHGDLNFPLGRAMAHLRPWLAARGPVPGPLLLPLRQKAGVGWFVVHGKPMGRRTLWKQVQRIGAKAGVSVSLMEARRTGGEP